MSIHNKNKAKQLSLNNFKSLPDHKSWSYKSLSPWQKSGIMNNIPELLILFLIRSGKYLGVRAVQALPRCNAKFMSAP